MTDSTERDFPTANRRRFLAALGTASIAGLGGCFGGDGNSPTDTATAPETVAQGNRPTTSIKRSEATDTPSPTRTSTEVCQIMTPAATANAAFLRGRENEPLALPAGQTTTVTLLVTAPFPVDLGEVTLDSPWLNEIVRRPEFKQWEEYDGRPVYAIARWELEVPPSAEGTYTMTASGDWSHNCGVGIISADQPITIAPGMTAPYGFNAGGWYDNDDDVWIRIDGLWFDNGTQGDERGSYVDIYGDASASPTDTAVGHTRSDADIVATEHDALYQTAHVGGNLGYDIAIENGTYDVRLYFAENDEEVEPGDRLFDVTVQGTTRLEAFDVADQNEFIHAPVIRTLEGVEVTEGTLSITTESIEGDSLVSGFSIREARDGDE